MSKKNQNTSEILPASNSFDRERIRKQAIDALRANDYDMANQLLSKGEFKVAELVEGLRIYEAELEIQNAELRESQVATEIALRRFSTLFSNMPVAVMVLDKHGLVQEANNEAQHLFGLKIEHLRQNFFLRLVDKSFHDSTAALLHLAGVKGYGNRHEVSFVDGQGNRFPGDLHIISQEAAIADRQELICVVVDQREQVAQRDALLQAQLSLQKSEARFAQIAEESREMVWEVDAEGMYTYVSHGSMAIFGYPPDELIGKKHFYDLHPEEQRERFKQTALGEFAKKRPFREYINSGQHRDGHEVWISTNGVPVLNEAGNLLGYRGSDSDFTLRKQAEEALHQSELRLRLTLENTKTGTWVWHVPSEKVEWDVQSYQMLGYEPDSFSLTLDSWQELLHPDDRNRIMATAYSQLSRGDFSNEFRCRTASGGWCWIQGRGSVVERDASGLPQRVLGTQIDISDRKQIEEALVASEKLFRTMADWTYDWEYWQDENHIIQYMTPSAERISGYMNEEFMKTPSLFDNLVFPEDRVAWLAHKENIHHKANHREIAKVAIRITRKDGEIRWIHHLCRPVYDQTGRFIGRRSVNRDITESKKAKDALRESEANLRQAQRIARVGSWELDLINDRLCWSDEIFRIFELDKTVFGATYEAFLNAIHPEDRGRVNQAYSDSLASQTPYEISHRLLMPDGRIKWVTEHCETTYDQAGTPLRSNGTVQDITERRRIEEQLQSGRERMELALEGGDLGMWDWRVDSGQVTFSERWCSMLGYVSGEIEPHVNSWKNLVHPDDWSVITAALEPHLKGQSPAYESEHRMRHKDGRWVWILDRGKVMQRDGEGKPLRVSGTHIDISKRKQTEEELLQLNRTLETRVQEETAKNREKDHLLIQQTRLAAMGEMIHNIAHQWRQPINALGLLLANILDDYDYQELTRESLQESVERGQQIIQNMSRTIDDFRDFFRTNKKMVVFDALRVLRQSCSMIEPSLCANYIMISLEGEQNLKIQGVENEYAQVVLNLIGNAQDVILARGIQNGNISIRLTQEGDQAILQTDDNGGGIPPDVMEKIFDPYFTTKERGSGIGLYMSKMIVEKNMNGRIAAENTHEGARFTISLPIVENSGLHGISPRDREEIFAMENHPAVFNSV